MTARKPRIYCDYNATAPLRPEARLAIGSALEQAGNASSVHAEGRKARSIVEAAREAVAAAVGACRDDITFTSGGTEAVALAIRGALLGAGNGLIPIASGIEHEAVARIAIKALWPTMADGQVDLDWLRHGLPELGLACRPLVCLMLINNETGVIQPVAEAAAIAHEQGALVFCDAIQALGKIEVSVSELDVDVLALSAHKIGGPQGVGAVYLKSGAKFSAIQVGGGQEFGRRAGTENVAGIAGFGAAAEAAIRDLSAYQGLAACRDRMEARLKAAAPTLVVHGAGSPRAAGVSCFGVEDLPAETQIMGLDLAGFALSAGSACSSGKVTPSRVLTAMGLPDSAARSAIRASFGWANTPADFDALAEAWVRLAARARPGLIEPGRIGPGLIGSGLSDPRPSDPRPSDLGSSDLGPSNKEALADAGR